MQVVIDLPLLKPVTCCPFLLEQPYRHWLRCKKGSCGINISHHVMDIPDKFHQRAAIIANMRPLNTPIRTIYNENDPIEAK